jgi:hypothetical protein
VHDNVALPEPAIGLGDTVHAVLLVANATLPVKPFNPVTVMEDVPAAPAFTVTLAGFAEIEKS